MELGALAEELRRAGLLVAAPECDTVIKGVTDDSRGVSEGSLFCAVKGTAQDGHDYLVDAAQRGAAAALVSRPCDVSMPQLVVSDGRAAAALVAKEWYGHPADRLDIVGVTGTNGKSTTVALIRHLLNAHSSVGSIGTVGIFDGQGAALQGYQALTTPGAVELQRILAELLALEVSTVVMEVSSHGLDQHRIDAIAFRTVVYTNLTHEHLDYHADMVSYGAIKMQLSCHLDSGGLEVVNADDAAWLGLPVRDDVRRMTYGLTTDNATVTARGVEYGAAGSHSEFSFGGETVAVELPLLGAYNVSNALAAAATAWWFGVTPDEIAERLSQAPTVPGRMEQLFSGEYTVLRDYAHTPDGFERALAALRPMTPGRLFLLFGAGGDRDPTKRSAMGSIAAREADVVIITSDNPRTEDPELILDQIEEGMGRRADVRLLDREDAIRRAVSMLREGDCLLLAGKGPETYQIVGAEKHWFDEKSVVAEVVGELGLA